MNIRKTGVQVAALLLAPLLTAAAVVEDEDQYVCWLVRAVECDSDMNCGPPATQPPNATLIHVDLEEGRITLLAPAERRGEVSQVRAMEREEGRVITSGIEAGQTWSVIISEPDGAATATVNFGDAALIAFARCIPEDQVSP